MQDNVMQLRPHSINNKVCNRSTFNAPINVMPDYHRYGLKVGIDGGMDC